MAIEIVPVEEKHLPALEQKIRGYTERRGGRTFDTGKHMAAARTSLGDRNTVFLVAVDRETGELVAYSYAHISKKKEDHVAHDQWTVNLGSAQRNTPGVGMELFKRKIG